jgi:hypothetical protein
LLPNESPEHYQALVDALRAEYQPQTPTEEILVDKMVQHHWLAQRASLVQSALLNDNPFARGREKSLGLMLRYQAHHDRSFQRALHDLLKLRAERRKEQIGFESQKRAERGEQRNESAELRKHERHQVTLSILKTKRDHQLLKNNQLELRLAREEKPKLGRQVAAQAA